MDAKQLIADKNTAIEQTNQEYEKSRRKLLDQLDALTRQRDETIAKHQQERDEAALQEKLKQFPAELVNNHKTCSVCGEVMRPYQFMEGEKIVKAWACRSGSLQGDHDLIRI